MDNNRPMMRWRRFGAMIAVSTAVMFPLMYHLVYRWDHAWFSVTRLIGALAMGCFMAAIMLAFMWKMYEPRRVKIMVLVALLLGGSALIAVNRQQMVVDDAAFMAAMIPHHSIAINNARNADIRDPRVRYLADRITRDQVKEIAEMELLLRDIRAHGRRSDLPHAPGTDRLSPEAAREARDLVIGKLLEEEPLR